MPMQMKEPKRRISFKEPAKIALDTLRAHKLRSFLTLLGMILAMKKDYTGAAERMKTYLKFAASDGYIRVTELQFEGKKKMKVEDFLRGYRF